MEEFNTKEKVEELFRNVNGLGENNCIFLCFLDTNREGLKYGALGAIKQQLTNYNALFLKTLYMKSF